MKKRIGFIEACMRHNRMMLFLIGALVLLGIYALKVMPKQEFPQVTVRQGVIVALYPGATSLEVEEQVAKPLEEFLYTFGEIYKEKSYSLSQDGKLFVMVELNPQVKNKDQVWSKIKHGLKEFKLTLPTGVLALVAKDDFGDTSALLISLESSDKSYRELEGYLTQLEGELRRIPSVSNLRRYGVQQEQISIYLDEEKMVAYGMGRKTVAAILFQQGFTTGGAHLEDEVQRLPIYVKTSYENEEVLANQIVYSDGAGNLIRLKDVAQVVREYPSPDSYIQQGEQRALVLSMEMKQGKNIVAYGQEVDQVLSAFQQQLPPSVSMERIADQPKVVNDSVTSFLRDLFLSIVVVVVVMMILFPFRSAVVAATSIPITIFISVAIMYFCGIELNTVTLAALIVVLGMIVDNSIIVIDAYLERLDAGLSRWHAAISSAKDYFASIFLATLCICVTFYPLLFTMEGELGDFLTLFPWTITISLMSSLAVAMIFIPFLQFVLIKQGLKARAQEKKEQRWGFNLLDPVQRLYEWVLQLTFRFPKLTILSGLLSVVVALLLFTQIDVRMMPRADRNQLAVEVYLPQGASLEQTAAVTDSLYTLLDADEGVTSVTRFVGSGSPRFQNTYAPHLPAYNYAQFIVNMQSNEATIALLDAYANEWANRFPNAYVKLKQLDYSNVATPVEVRFRGEDIASLRESADSLMQHMKALEGLVWIHTNYEEMVPSVQVALDPVAASRLGITRTSVASDLSVNYGGVPVGTLWEGNYPLNVVLKRAVDEDSQAYSGVGNTYLTTWGGGMVPLRQVGEITPIWTPGQIVRRNGVRTLSVMADVKRGYSEGALIKEVQQLMEKEVAPLLPQGVAYEYGGNAEKDKETIVPIVNGLAIAVVIIFLFLLFNFKKLSIALVALFSTLLCLLGAALGLWIAGVSFSLTCVLGIISLLGIIVRNAIIMFEYAEDLHHQQHYSARNAAYEAGKRRMLPIFLTSATTAFGVVPMILSQSSLWMPMGIVICMGTVVSMVLVVTVLPVVYWKIYRKEAI
ncbi:MAG: efflux RND transporter permease subunit [Phocaeicola sp.]